MADDSKTQPTGGDAGASGQGQGSSTGATGQQGVKLFTQDEANSFAAEGRRAVQAELEKAQSELTKLREAAMTADEKKLEEARKAAREEAEAGFAKERLRFETRIAVAGKVRPEDVEMVAGLIPADTPAEKIGAEVEKILKARPYLLAETVTPGVPAGGPAPTPGAGVIKRSDIQKWMADGTYAKHRDDVLAAQRGNRIVNDVA